MKLFLALLTAATLCAADGPRLFYSRAFPGSQPPYFQVTLDKDEISFALKVDITLSVPGADKAAVKALLDDAHTICPYSRATRGNVPVTLTVV